MEFGTELCAATERKLTISRFPVLADGFSVSLPNRSLNSLEKYNGRSQSAATEKPTGKLGALEARTNRREAEANDIAMASFSHSQTEDLASFSHFGSQRCLLDGAPCPWSS